MSNQIKEELGHFRSATLNILETLRVENYDTLEELFSKRQEIIDTINKLSYTKDEFIAICAELEIEALQCELAQQMNEKRDQVIGDIKKLSDSKSANKNYNVGFSVDSLYLNKKI